jgi:leucyl aminopeptidase
MLSLKSVDLKKEKIESLVVPVCEDRNIHDDKKICSLINTAKKVKAFNGGKDDEVVLYHLPDVKAESIIFFGLGKLEKVDAESLRTMAGRAVKNVIKKQHIEVLIAVPSAEKMNIKMQVVLEAMMEGAFLGNHLYDRYKKEKKHQSLLRINFFVNSDEAKIYKKLPSRISAICRGTILAREWVSMPPNDKRPEFFAKSIESHAKKENLNVIVFNEKELKQKKFGAMLAVAAGSMNKPRMVILEHLPAKATKTVALVGKGVTFDSGGLNLKPSASLSEMKMDMAGAAVVAATLITAARLKLNHKIVGIIPIVENMPSGNATRPGDIIQSYHGKTVEIGNTDAEGRLILIDALSYAIKKYRPQTLIDVATLTGACVVALGEKIAGTFSFDDDLAKNIILSGRKTHERCWRMPMPEDYKDLLKSDFADLNNVGSTRSGGAITAALFLSEFVKDTSWAHIDIAGPAYAKKESAYCGVGGTGFGVRLLCDLMERL